MWCSVLAFVSENKQTMIVQRDNGTIAQLITLYSLGLEVLYPLMNLVRKVGL